MHLPATLVPPDIYVGHMARGRSPRFSHDTVHLRRESASQIKLSR